MNFDYLTVLSNLKFQRFSKIQIFAKLLLIPTRFEIFLSVKNKVFFDRDLTQLSSKIEANISTYFTVFSVAIWPQGLNAYDGRPEST